VIGAHLAILVRQKHTQFPGPGRREDNVVGERVWPTFAAKGLGLFFLTGAVLSLLGGVAQINPIWLYGPYRPADVSSASQPDWYMGWLDGALRLMPNWETRAFGYEIPNPFFPGVLLPGITFTLLFLWPFLEARVTKDREPHHLLDRPRDRPLRTALGVATLTFYTVLFFAGASDVLAITFDLSVNSVFVTLRVLLFLLPPVSGWLAFRLCKELAARDRPGASEQATVPGEAAPSSGEEHRREIAPEDETAAAGAPRR
jgi:ubiquinol-cytochrome c reductase cytochrome b subunit